MHVYNLRPQLLLLPQVCRLRSLVKLRIGDESQRVLDTACDRGLLAKTMELSDDLRPSGEDPSHIAVVIDEAHSGIPDEGAYIKNVAA